MPPWPDGKHFAFTVFDDPDSQPLEESRLVYGLLEDLGLRTTKGVWPLGPFRQGNSRSESCENPAYRQHVQELQRAGFEIGYHGAALNTSNRARTLAGLDAFREYFGADPSAMANHFDNDEGIYFGPNRVSGIRRWIYNAATFGKHSGRYSGEIAGHANYWGDLCEKRIRYCRNFVFRDINTLARCPLMPYHDPERPLVPAWYASSEGANADLFMATISEPNQDRLESEGGACIMYTHFGNGFCENGKIKREFRRLMQRLRDKNGWFVPVSTLLDHLAAPQGLHCLTARERAQLEWSWLREKLARGSS